jgi:hypothetical protein
MRKLMNGILYVVMTGCTWKDVPHFNETIIEKGVIPIIAARSNSVENILKTEKGNHFRAQYIPRVYHKLLGKLYNIRTTVERKN